MSKGLRRRSRSAGGLGLEAGPRENSGSHSGPTRGASGTHPTKRHVSRNANRMPYESAKKGGGGRVPAKKSAGKKVVASRTVKKKTVKSAKKRAK